MLLPTQHVDQSFVVVRNNRHNVQLPVAADNGRNGSNTPQNPSLHIVIVQLREQDRFSVSHEPNLRRCQLPSSEVEMTLRFLELWFLLSEETLTKDPRGQKRTFIVESLVKHNRANSALVDWALLGKQLTQLGHTSSPFLFLTDYARLPIKDKTPRLRGFVLFHDSVEVYVVEDLIPHEAIGEKLAFIKPKSDLKLSILRLIRTMDEVTNCAIINSCNVV